MVLRLILNCNNLGWIKEGFLYFYIYIVWIFYKNNIFKDYMCCFKRKKRNLGFFDWF